MPEPHADEPPPFDYQLKAVYLFKFTRYITWPDQPKSLGSAKTICLYRENDFGSAIDVAQDIWDGPYDIAVNVIFSDNALENCHILYIPGRFGTTPLNRLTAEQRFGLLTVGEAKNFLRQGGSIRFVTGSQNINFDISRRAASQAGLSISSRLLRVARSVTDD